MDEPDTLDGTPRSKSVAMLTDWSGAKVYMTRPALRELAAELLRISEADPKECFEVHLSILFSHFGANNEYLAPRARFANGLGPVFERIQRKVWLDEPDSGKWNAGSGFDVTIMHIPPEMVGEEVGRPDE
ncbi:hypothetical protein ABMA32_09130 [Mesorhizobium sp. VNQ89]|uniref:hypothetical protein n=1 Tax=Mesorhizobium quangtriensis TaxID=3157709 RepID=UPI0032B81657